MFVTLLVIYLLFAIPAAWVSRQEVGLTISQAVVIGLTWPAVLIVTDLWLCSQVLEMFWDSIRSTFITPNQEPLEDLVLVDDTGEDAWAEDLVFGISLPTLPEYADYRVSYIGLDGSEIGFLEISAPDAKTAETVAWEYRGNNQVRTVSATLINATEETE